MAQTAGGQTRGALGRDFPGVGFLEHGERVRAVFGRPMTRGATAREAMEDWMDLYQPVFGVEDLEWSERYGAEISRGRIAFALRQEVTVEGGILPGPTALPVEGGRLRVLVAPDAEDLAVTYVAARVIDTDGGIAAPQITGAQAIAAAGRDERTQHLRVWSEPELVVVEIDLGAGPEVLAAWRLAGLESETAVASALAVYVDAVTGAVVRVESGVLRNDPVTGVVEGGATAGVGPPFSSGTQVTELPDVEVCIIGEDCTHSALNGSYGLETTSSSVNVKATFDAGRWLTSTDTYPDADPIEMTYPSAVMPPASGIDFTFNSNPSTQEDTAPVNVFLRIQESDSFFAQRVGNWESLFSSGPLAPLTTYANSGDPGICGYCTGGLFLPSMPATGATIFTCITKSSGSPPYCNNSGYSTIIAHEYGHYIAHFLIGVTGQSAFSEGYGDGLWVLMYNDGVIGSDYFSTGFHLREPGSATITYPACEKDAWGNPLWHENGELLARIWWDIRNGIGLAPAGDLFVDWTLISDGPAPPDDREECQGFDQPADTGTLIEVLMADDVDGDISNGTPNDSVICQAFADRGIETQFGISPCPAPLHGGGTCRADLNYDHVLDIFDFLEFERMFVFGDMFCDFDGSGVLDFFDLLTLQDEYEAGCW